MVDTSAAKTIITAHVNLRDPFEQLMTLILTIAVVILLFIILAMFPMWAIGMITVIQWYRGKLDAPGVDSSNVINMIRLWWFALTRPERSLPAFPWLANDEMDNMRG